MAARETPHRVPKLDPDFRPAALQRRAFCRAAEETRGPELHFALQREGTTVSLFHTRLVAEGHALARDNEHQAERLLKFLLWQRGARRVLVAGPRNVTSSLVRAYGAGGSRAFDAEFMRRVYGEVLQVLPCPEAEMPAESDPRRPISGRLDGCRIGFDAGGSDRKVSAVIDGKVVHSSEQVWHPKLNSDPAYHVRGIRQSLATAAEHLPRIDAIGVSSAGIYVDNQTRVASLFRLVSEADFEREVKDIYIDLARSLGAPLVVANDGDVTALAGFMSLGQSPLLGLALGTSLAAGYVDARGRITGWLNELAFAPVDYAKRAAIDTEWSNDQGVGSTYLSQ
jgi:hypothetical protein